MRPGAASTTDEISKTIWNLASLLVASSVFCLIILGAPDVSLVSTDAKINIPVAGISVSYPDFLLFAPVFLIGLTLYLHVFPLRYLSNLDRCRHRSRRPPSAPARSSGRLYYIGQSHGGALGAIFSAVEPAVRASVINVAGGSIMEHTRLSAVGG